MTDLLVDRLHARATVTTPDDETRVRTLLADLTDRRLDEALGALSPRQGDWYLRRLEVPLALERHTADGALGRRWARVVVDAIALALATDDAQVVHYARSADAVADVVAALSVGDTGRRWAWRAAGVLTTGDPDPVGSPAAAALAALGRHPDGAVAALGAAVRRAGLPAVHRLLGRDGWRRVAVLILAVHGLTTEVLGGSPRDLPSGGTGSGPGIETWLDIGFEPDGHPAASANASAPNPTPSPTPDAAPDPTTIAPRETATATSAAVPIVAGLLARSTFADTWRRSRLRPDTTSARVWAALVVAEAEPALFRRPVLPAVLAILPAAVAGDFVAAAPRHVRTLAPTTESESSPASPARPGPSASTPTVQPAPAPQPTPQAALQSPLPSAVATQWGGLVYLLAAAAEAGMPDDALADEVLGEQPSAWILLHLLALLCTGGAPADDPALHVLAGLPATGPVPAGEPTAAQRERLDRHADSWADATCARLGDAVGPDDRPRTVVARLAARAGTVDATPGWVEFRLRLDDVDVDVRRAGLDLDPGFVPWLGAVVVIRYE